MHTLKFKKGYKEGLMISNGSISKGIEGEMCQYTNLTIG